MKLSIEVTPDVVRIAYRIYPKWLHIFSIASQLLGGLLAVLSFAQTLRFEHDLNRIFAGRPGVSQAVASIHGDLVFHGLSAACLITVAFFSIWKYRRFGRVPRVLTIDANEVVLTYLGFYCLREKRWPMNEISNIDLAMTRWKLTAKPHAVLRFHRRSGRTLRFAVWSSDVQVLHSMAAQIAIFLKGCGYETCAVGAALWPTS